MPWRDLTASLVLICGLALAACGAREDPAPAQAPLAPQDCPALYVVAPGNYILDLAAGASVLLDPAAHEFPLFCAPATAAKALREATATGRVPAGDWRVYRLEGGFADLVQEASPGGPSPYALARRARLADWITEANAEEKGGEK